MPYNSVPELCDKYLLHWMCLSDDLSYHFKYLDVINERAKSLLDNGFGVVEKEKYCLFI